MGRREQRRPRRWRSAPAGRKRQESGSTITIAEGEGKGMVFSVHWSAEDVEGARRSCAAGRPDHVALTIVLAFLQYLGVPCEAEDLADQETWPPGDIVTLFAMLGMPLVEGWTEEEDAELERLLTEGGGRG
ncbi:hypothetical protein O3Q52_47730 [Streptomyces sp. ActVer]|uniref:hypothetical protein n=1 Tax=Streptomyces sp. ActVer TaxID=3014558 RepID=UPI0022B4BCE7|nr:hypothetical protein [Streptomyces sp. ActVer]MCZ4515674.1 hypothetical protein [Streptomyces sp. ActVer]